MGGTENDGSEQRLRDAGLEFERAPLRLGGLNPFHEVRLVVWFIAAFRRIRPDIVHAFTIKPVIFGLIAAAMARVPVRVATITGLGYTFTSASRPIRAIVVWLYRQALKFAHVVVFQNDEDMQLFLTEKIVDRKKCQVVYGSGVDSKNFSPVPLPMCNGKPITFLMIARLIKEKGVFEFLEAAQIVSREQGRTARFFLLGGTDPGNPTSLNMKEIESLRANQFVTWHEEATDVRPYIAQADVVVLPSYREGLPRTLLEGGAMGRALIAADVTGCREVVKHGENGYLVPVANAEALASAMLMMIREPDVIQKMGEMARRLILERFDERIVLDATLKCYQSLLNHEH